MSASVRTSAVRSSALTQLGAPLPNDPPMNWALAYAAIGCPVFPLWWTEGGRCACCAGAACRSPGKHPIHTVWKRNSTTDPAAIRRAWMRHPKAHVAVHTGKAGILAVDIDPRNGGDATMLALERQHGPLVAEVVARTGGGGEHRIFAVPEGGGRIPGKLGPGIEVKHGDSYIVVAPSGHVSGGTYAWEPGRDPFDNAFLLVPPPAWVLGGGTVAPDAGAAEDDWTAGIPVSGIEETPENVARLRSALDHVPADCSRDEWRNHLFAIHSTGWDCAEDIAVEWSLTAPELWEEGAFRGIWDTAKPGRAGGRTVGSIFYTARRNGWRDPLQAKPETIGDLSNGRRFAERQRGRMLFVRTELKWRHFDELRWARCDAGQEIHAAKDIADELVASAGSAVDENPTDENKKRYGLALGIHRSGGRVREMVTMAASEPGMSVPSPTAFDADPWLLGVQNGVVDLRTGRLLVAEPSQRISKQAGAAFRPEAECPRWMDFLHGVFGDAEVVAFVQRAAGYTLTGLVDEEKLFFCHGVGANGKSVFANVLCGVLGDYAATVGSELLARNKHGNEAARYKNRLQGARLALANEVGEGDTWDDHHLKELVSRERIAARALYGEAYDFTPSHKLWVRGNHKPGILDAGDGMWRRVVLIGFERQIPEAERVPDLDRQLLAAERDGILGWMVQGCLAWQQVGGLEVPASIARATATYREDSDVLGGWLADRFAVASGERVQVAPAYSSFQQYFKDAGMIAPSRPAFVRRMGQRGFKRARSNGVDSLLGLRLRGVAYQVGGDDDGFEL